MRILEVWRDIEGTNGNYKVSNTGLVRSCRSNILLKPRLGTNGYNRVHIQGKDISIHRLVAMAFKINPFNKPYVNHKNGIRVDNRAINLEWVTPRENTVHAVGNLKGRTWIDRNRPLGRDKVIEVVARRNRGDSMYRISKDLGIGSSTVYGILTGVTYKDITKEYLNAYNLH